MLCRAAQEILARIVAFDRSSAASLSFSPSAQFCCRLLDRDSEFTGSGRQAPIERDEGRIEAAGNREMEGVRRT